MIDVLTFAGKRLDEFSTFYDSSQIFIKPAKDVEQIAIAGRNGELTLSNNRFENVEIPFNCFIREDFKNNYEALVDFLTSTEGYQRLEFSQQPNVYRMAQFVEGIKPSTGAFLKYGSFELVFNCKPQIYLTSGDNEIEIESGDVLNNPTNKVAKPLIMVDGVGSITINNRTLTLATNTSTTYIDCDIQDAYEGVINRNGDLTIQSEFPQFNAGENTITYTGFSKVVIKPRWWRI